MMKIWLFCFILIYQNLFCLTLKEKLIQAEPGAYVVAERGSLVFLIHFHSKEGARFVFEEISIPACRVKNLVSWKEWGQQGAQGHSSWMLYEIDMEKGCLSECYSPSLKAWVSTEELQPLLLPLISLELHYLSEEKRLQKEPTQRPGSMSLRPWSPLQVKNGQAVPNPSYDVYRAKWPRDGTSMSGKQIVLYFDKESPHFPFPYWLQAQDGAIKFKIRAIDSGMGFSSPMMHLPRQGLSFKGGLKKRGGLLCLTLNVPLYYETLSLYAVDLTNCSNPMQRIPFKGERKKRELTLLVEEQTIERSLVKGHEYLWMIAAENPALTIESPFTYTQR